MKKSIETIYIAGLGALGGIYAAALFDIYPDAVKIIANKNRITSLENTKTIINGKAYAFDFVSPEHKPDQPADLILIAVKSMHLPQAINDIKNLIGKDTTVISLLNGISSEELIGAEIGMEHLLYAYAVGMDAVRAGRNISFKNAGRIVFGEKNNEVTSERVQAVKELFDLAKITYQVPPDMIRALWFKFMMNTGINQASAVLKAPYGTFQQNKDARELMLMASAEVIALSQKTGINLEQTHINEFKAILDTLDPSGKTSMLQDIEAGRKSEIDLFAGTIIELGKKYNVPTPVNKILHTIILSMEPS